MPGSKWALCLEKRFASLRLDKGSPGSLVLALPTRNSSEPLSTGSQILLPSLTEQVSQALQEPGEG